MISVSRAQVRRCLSRIFIAIGAVSLLAMAVSPVARFTVRVGAGSFSLGGGAVAWRWAATPYTQAGQPVAPPPYLFTRDVSWWWVPRWFGRPGDGEVVFPLWIPLLVGAIALYRTLPAGAPAGRCHRCRFDLAGAPEVKVEHVHVRCPECGSISALDRPAPPSGPAQSH